MIVVPLYQSRRLNTALDILQKGHSFFVGGGGGGGAPEAS